jgi:hypothetical protein
MKNSIQIIAITLITFSNVVTASNLNSNRKVANDDKIKNAKLVTYAEPKLIKSELGTLVGYSKTIQNKIAEDAKIIDEATTDSDIAFVAYADENLAENELNFNIIKISTEEKIMADAKIIEILDSNIKNFSFVTYADSNLINSEVSPLKNTSVTIGEKIKSNNKVIESKILNYKLKPLKNNNSKKAIIIINARKY